MALGAFLAGMLLAETEFRHTIEVDIAPFKGLLLGLFFMSVGMGIDLQILSHKWLWVAGSVIGLFMIKIVIITGLCRLFKLPNSIALPTGIMLGQGGEFAFVVVGLAVSYKLMPTTTGHFMLLVASFTMMLTPILAHYADQLWRTLQAQENRNHPLDTSYLQMPNNGDNTLIIAGYGRVARVLCSTLAADEVRFVCIEHNSIKVKAAQKNGLQVFFGDVTHLDILKAANMTNTSTLVITIDNGFAAETLVHAVRQTWAGVFIVARARDMAHAQKLIALGANDVILETLEASLQLSSIVMRQLGLPDIIIQQRVQQTRHIESGVPSDPTSDQNPTTKPS